jgi:Uma2 family endonuclease
VHPIGSDAASWTASPPSRRFTVPAGGSVAELPTCAAERTVMGMPELQSPPPSYWTRDLARALPEDGRRYEVVHGELLVTPAPAFQHQELVGRLYRALADYLDREQVGHVMLSPADISWDDETLLQPDLFVADREEARTMDWSRIQHLLLVIEVLSPSTARFDRFTKRRRYQEAAIPLYWIVDPEGRQVEIWTPADHIPRIERDFVTWSPIGATTPFSISLQALFQPLL